MYRLAVLNSHPIQYFAPLYRYVARQSDIDLTVYYCSRQGVDTYVDEGFGEEVQWDIPLLDGYDHRFLSNLADGPVGGFFSLVNPSIVPEIVQGQYDALWIHGHKYATYLLGIAAAKLAGTAVLMRGETHLLLDRSRWKEKLRTPLMSAFYQLCDGMLAIGTRNQAFYRAHGVPDEAIFHVPYTVDNEFFRDRSTSARRNPSQVRREFGLPTDRPVVLFASKFIERKRPLDLLRAFERVRDERDVALAFVGDGPLMDDLQTHVSRREIPDVHFLGFRNQSELPKIYGCADVFVLPSQNEPWGLVINEVMAAGLPVITTREVGAAADLVREGENGFTYETGDLDALADCLGRLVADGERREEKGRRSRNIIDGWSYEECVEGIRTALSTVASRPEV